MKTIIKKTNNFTKRDEFNIKAGARALKEANGMDITVKGACVGEDLDKDGKPVSACALVTDKGAYTGISATAIDLTESIIDMINEDEQPLVIHIETRKSNNGRDYITFSIVG